MSATEWNYVRRITVGRYCFAHLVSYVYVGSNSGDDGELVFVWIRKTN